MSEGYSGDDTRKKLGIGLVVFLALIFGGYVLLGAGPQDAGRLLSEDEETRTTSPTPSPSGTPTSQPVGGTR